VDPTPRVFSVSLRKDKEKGWEGKSQPSPVQHHHQRPPTTHNLTAGKAIARE